MLTKLSGHVVLSSRVVKKQFYGLILLNVTLQQVPRLWELKRMSRCYIHQTLLPELQLSSWSENSWFLHWRAIRSVLSPYCLASMWSHQVRSFVRRRGIISMLMITRLPSTHYWVFLTIYPFLWINLFANIITLFSIKFLKKLEHLDLSEDLLDG